MGNARKILVVDDDPALREGLEKDLSGMGHSVATASSGEDALWQLDNDIFDAVFTGLVLRGISGVEVAEEIQARQPGLPVVIISENGSVAFRERATLAGVNQILSLPVSAEQLADAAERALKAAESAAGRQVEKPAMDAEAAKAGNPFLSRLRNIFLFLIGPVISLFYLITFPVIGLGMLIYMASTAKEKRPEAAESVRQAPQAKSSVLKSIAIMLGMVLSGVVYGAFVPILGIGLVIWFALQAWSRLGARAVGPGQT